MSDQGNPAERRSYPRLDAAVDVEILIDSAPDVRDLDGKSILCRTADISLRGVRLLADTELPVGAHLKMRIKLPRQEERHRQSGRVVWCRPNREPAAGPGWHAGIEFSLAGNPDFDAWRGALLRLFEAGAGG